LHRPIQSSKTMAIDINDLTGASKVRTASWEKEAFDRWEKYGVDENGVPQKIQHRVKNFLLSYGTGWEAFLEGGEALELVDEYQRNEYGFYYDYSAEYIPELKGTQAEYVKRVLDGINDKAKEECINNLMGKPSGFIEANDENTDLSQHMSYRVEQNDGVDYVVYTSENELNRLRLEVARAEEKIQGQQDRITELEALTAPTTASPEETTDTIQALQARITELEDENEYLRDNQRNKKQGKQQRGTLGLKACQRIGAFAILLELLTGKDVGILQEDGRQNSHLKTLYSEVTGANMATTTADISKLQDREHEIRKHTRDKIRTELTSLLQAMGIAFGE